MSRTRRSFTPEFKVEAARRVIEGGRSVAEVARELNVHENLLRKGLPPNGFGGAAADARRVPPDGDLSAAERAELVRLRTEGYGSEDPGPLAGRPNLVVDGLAVQG